MKFVKAKYEIWDAVECTPENILKTIERAAKVCYKSETNIKDGSAEPFVKNLIKRGHTSCLEHGAIYLKVSYIPLDSMEPEIYAFLNKCSKYDASKDITFETHMLHVEVKSDVMYIYTNARFLYEKCPKLFWDVILDRELPDFIELFTPAENDPYRRQTVMFTADQRITEEFIRHRVASPNKESTRYCVYSSDKHGGELTYIIPLRLNDVLIDGDVPEEIFYMDNLRWKVRGKIVEDDVELLLDTYKNNETSYIKLVKNFGWRGEEARIVLPLGVKADLVLTNSLIDWCIGRNEPVDFYETKIEDGEVCGKRIKGFFGLRTDGAAHPQARELAIPLMKDFENRNWIKDDEK